jgi:NADH-quinone oxidoreductase subunit L
MPHTAIVFVVGTLSLAGIPLFGGFLSKEEILSAVWTGGPRGTFIVLVVVASLTAFYMFRVVFVAFFGGSAHDTADHGHSGAHAHDPPGSMRLPLWILAALSIVVGVYSTLVGRVLPLGPAEHEASGPVWLTPLAVGVALAGIALAWLTYQRRAIEPARLAAMFGPIRRAAMARFWIDDVFEGAFNTLLLGFSRLVGWLDRYLVDGVLNFFSAWTVKAGDDLRSIQTGRAQDYVYGVGVGLLVLLLWMRWALA